jgi:hypothetical protein
MRAHPSFLLAASLFASAAFAQVNPAEPDPSAWLKQVYALYAKAQGNEKLQGAANMELVEKRASKALAALFQQDADCVKKSEGVCALDWDFVVDGQDYQLSQVKVGPTRIAGDKASVTVSFLNMKTPCVNVYAFVKEDGVWKVDDIETRPKGETPTRIAKMLRDFKG